jgi:hypothetical protein
MRKTIVYYLPSGELSAIATLDEAADPTGLNGDLFMEVPAPVSGHDYWVSNGVLTEYSESAKQAKLNPPPYMAEWIPAEGRWQDIRNADQLAADSRRLRDQKLARSDWIVTRSAERNEPVPSEWAAYRQALRDVPQQPGFPETITWPTPPNE